MMDVETIITKEQACVEIAQAMRKDDEEAVVQGWKHFHDSITQEIKNDFSAFQSSNDVAVLAQRGYRQLTSQEKAWYRKVTDALKSKNPKQAFVDIIGTDNEDDLMPITIIEDVFRGLREQHELLDVINFQYVGYTTKWILNSHGAQRAIWGQITDEITKEIESGFKVIDLSQNKLSAYCFIERGMLDMGPTFLDAYIRACLSEAIYLGLEYGIVKGTGVNEPIGLIRDISATASFNPTTGWAAKEKIAITEITAASYGELLGTLAETEDGKSRTFGEVVLLCNQKDYLTKVIPATKVMGVDGRYVSVIDTIYPTRIIRTSMLDNGEAILFIPDEYFFGVGASARNGVIEYSDEFKFLDDLRYFKIVQYGAGRCLDNTSAVYLDISNLQLAAIPVKAITEAVIA